MDKSYTSPNKCLVCFCSIRSERTKDSEQFTIVFDTFCRLLKVDLIKPMQWNFEEDHIPFCEFCSSAVEKLQGLHEQIESLQHQMINMLSRIKYQLQISGSDLCTTNELTANNRVTYFRKLAVGGSFNEVDGTVSAEVSSLNVDSMVEVRNQLDEHSSIELPFLARINESCEFDDADTQFDPLLIVKREDDSTSDCMVDTESISHDNLESVTELMLQDSASSAEKLEIEREEIKADLPEHHKCTFCDKTFRGKLSLDRHVKQHLGKKNKNYQKCKGTFISRNDLSSHETQIHGNECPQSSEIVNSVEQLDIELTRIDLPFNGNVSAVTNNKNNLCEVCEKGDASSERFSGLHRLTCYRRIHTGEKKYKCDYCDKRFVQRSRLIEHRRGHIGERPYKCDVCNKAFLSSHGLTMHKRIHIGNKPYKCDVCKKSFFSINDLVRHNRIHTGEKPYKCDICNKSFSQLSTLAGHKSMHTGERPYKCEVCCTAFSFYSSLCRHRKRKQHSVEQL